MAFSDELKKARNAGIQEEWNQNNTFDMAATERGAADFVKQAKGELIERAHSGHIEQRRVGKFGNRKIVRYVHSGWYVVTNQYTTTPYFNTGEWYWYVKNVPQLQAFKAVVSRKLRAEGLNVWFEYNNETSCRICFSADLES